MYEPLGIVGVIICAALTFIVSGDNGKNKTLEMIGRILLSVGWIVQIVFLWLPNFGNG